jgi:heme/copper-type cytochrome/quinol oxidase subunit 1
VTSSRRAAAAWATASVLVLTGVVVLIVGLLTPPSYGWFAYQPLAGATFTPGGSDVVLSRVTIIGSIALTTGLLALAFLAGRRSGAKRSPQIDDSDRAR